MEIVLFGCKDTTLLVGKFLRRCGVEIHLVTISSSIARKNDVAGYTDLTSYPDVFKTVYVAKSYGLGDSEDREFFAGKLPSSLGFCVGWQRLLPAHVLSSFSLGVHGMHGSARDLPFGKGRSPMNWAIIEGREFFFTNLFRYTAGVDDGPVVAKSCFSINATDTAESLHFKNAISMCYIIKDNFLSLSSGREPFVPQDHSGGESFYPKRSPDDGVIDWRDDVHNIERLVRAVARHFMAPHLF